MLLFARNTDAETCIPPQASSCVFLSPSINHSWIKVNFKRNILNQIVYLDGGCSIGIEKFTPTEPIKNIHPDLNMTLKFTLCVNDQLINEEDINIGNEGEVSIICDYDNKLVCKKIPKKQSSWDTFTF